MPHVMEAVRAYATVGEMTSVLKDVFGEFEEPVGLYVSRRCQGAAPVVMETGRGSDPLENGRSSKFSFCTAGRGALGSTGLIEESGDVGVCG